MARYLKHIAQPEGQLYSGRNSSYSFEAFLEALTLKCPRSSWLDTELCALFRAELIKKAQNQYEALPRSEQNGGIWYWYRL